MATDKYDKAASVILVDVIAQRVTNRAGLQGIIVELFGLERTLESLNPVASALGFEDWSTLLTDLADPKQFTDWREDLVNQQRVSVRRKFLGIH